MEVELLPENYQNGDKNTPNYEFETRLDASVKKIVKNEGFIDYNIDKKCVSTNGGNYLAVLYEIDVTGTTKNGEKELNLFVKNVIESENCKILSIDGVYNTELYAYKELSKIFADLQENANVPIDERYKMAKMYDGSNAEAIIFENVCKQGFTTYHRTENMSLNFIEICIKQLAKFHALSFVIKEKMPEYFAKKIKPIKNAFIFEEEWLNLCKSVKEIGLRNTDEDIRDKLEKAYDNAVINYKEYANDENIKACFCHGDYRPNNIMTKINDDGTVTEILPVDYQLIHYGSPVFDILYLLYISTDRKFRKAHMAYLKNLYYETLSKFLGYFDLDPNKIYPREDFEKVFKEKLDQGLMVALLFLPFTLAAQDDIPDVSKQMSDMVFRVEDSFRERIRDVIEEFVEWGWL